MIIVRDLFTEYHDFFLCVTLWHMSHTTPPHPLSLPPTTHLTPLSPFHSSLTPPPHNQSPLILTAPDEREKERDGSG